MDIQDIFKDTETKKIGLVPYSAVFIGTAVVLWFSLIVFLIMANTVEPRESILFESITLELIEKSTNVR